MSLRYIVSPVTVQRYALDYKALSWRRPIKHLLVTFFLYLHLPRHLESFSPSSHHHLCSICRYSISIQLSLAWINSIIAISIRLSTRIRLDCPYHAGISLILTLLSCSTSIEPWDESTLAPITTNCLTWAPTYRLALLCSLCNQISSSTHSGVVWGHIVLWTLGSSTSGDEKLGRLKSYWEFQGRD